LLVTAAEVAVIGEYLALARLLSPSIVVIEDVDLIARDRDDMQTPGQESLLNRLLNEMDGLRENSDVLFVLTTNRAEALEPALAGRPGRIDQAIEFPLPDPSGRRRLVELYRHGLVVPEKVLDNVVERTEGASAAFIRELMRRTAQFVLEGSDAPNVTLSAVDSALGELLFDGGSLNAKLLGAEGALRH
jgi:ATP-dependent 26S proteasome regulatory subunit